MLREFPKGNRIDVVMGGLFVVTRSVARGYEYHSYQPLSKPNVVTKNVPFGLCEFSVTVILCSSFLQ